MVKAKRIAIYALAFVICSLLFMPVSFLELSHYHQGVVYQRIVVRPDTEYTIRYIHSVMKTPVYEHYRALPDGRMMLTETIFSSYGAGLPETTTNKFEMTDKGFRIYDINQPFDFIVYRTAPVETGADITLILQNQEYSFLSFSSERTPVRIMLKRQPTGLYQIREGSEWLMKRSAQKQVK